MYRTFSDTEKVINEDEEEKTPKIGCIMYIIIAVSKFYLQNLRIVMLENLSG